MITMLVKEQPLSIHREAQPEVVEFVDGASDVPFIKVPFFPLLFTK